MRRREFIAGLGSTAAAWPLAARAQQPKMPLVGLLSGASFEGPYAVPVTAIRQGLRETGFVEGQNVAIEYRHAGGQYERLPELAADLFRRQAAVIVAIGDSTPARAATSPMTCTRLASVYAGRILNGAEPGESPVMLPTRFELVINDRTAKALRVAVPRRRLSRADEIID